MSENQILLADQAHIGPGSKLSRNVLYACIVICNLFPVTRKFVELLSLLERLCNNALTKTIRHRDRPQQYWKSDLQPAGCS